MNDILSHRQTEANGTKYSHRFIQNYTLATFFHFFQNNCLCHFFSHTDYNRGGLMRCDTKYSHFVIVVCKKFTVVLVCSKRLKENMYRSIGHSTISSL